MVRASFMPFVICSFMIKNSLFLAWNFSIASCLLAMLFLMLLPAFVIGHSSFAICHL